MHLSATGSLHNLRQRHRFFSKVRLPNWWRSPVMLGITMPSPSSNSSTNAFRCAQGGSPWFVSFGLMVERKTHHHFHSWDSTSNQCTCNMNQFKHCKAGFFPFAGAIYLPDIYCWRAGDGILLIPSGLFGISKTSKAHGCISIDLRSEWCSICWTEGLFGA